MAYIMILSNLKQFLKNWFFTKNAIFCNFFGFFDLIPKYRFFAENSWNLAKIASKSLSESPNISQIHWMILYNDLRKIEKIVKIEHFSYNSPFGPEKGNYTKNDRFLRFFQSSSNHYIISSNVFGLCLGTRRGFWKHF